MLRNSEEAAQANLQSASFAHPQSRSAGQHQLQKQSAPTKPTTISSKIEAPAKVSSAPVRKSAEEVRVSQTQPSFGADDSQAQVRKEQPASASTVSQGRPRSRPSDKQPVKRGNSAYSNSAGGGSQPQPVDRKISDQEKAEILKKEMEEFGKDDGEADEAYEPDYEDDEHLNASG